MTNIKSMGEGVTLTEATPMMYGCTWLSETWVEEVDKIRERSHHRCPKPTCCNYLAYSKLRVFENGGNTFKSITCLITCG